MIEEVEGAVTSQFCFLPSFKYVKYELSCKPRWFFCVGYYLTVLPKCNDLFFYYPAYWYLYLHLTLLLYLLQFIAKTVVLVELQCYHYVAWCLVAPTFPGLCLFLHGAPDFHVLKKPFFHGDSPIFLSLSRMQECNTVYIYSLQQIVSVQMTTLIPIAAKTHGTIIMWRGIVVPFSPPLKKKANKTPIKPLVLYLNHRCNITAGEKAVKSKEHLANRIIFTRSTLTFFLHSLWNVE